jgi:hypothetical protein
LVHIESPFFRLQAWCFPVFTGFGFHLPPKRRVTPYETVPRLRDSMPIHESDCTVSQPSRYAALLNLCAAALNQYDQHDDEQHARNNPDQRGTVH